MNVDSPKIEAGRTWNPVIKTCNPMLIVDSPTGIYMRFQTRHIKVVLKDKSGDILYFSLLNLCSLKWSKMPPGSTVWLNLNSFSLMLQKKIYQTLATKTRINYLLVLAFFGICWQWGRKEEKYKILAPFSFKDNFFCLNLYDQINSDCTV